MKSAAALPPSFRQRSVSVSSRHRQPTVQMIAETREPSSGPRSFIVPMTDVEARHDITPGLEKTTSAADRDRGAWHPLVRVWPIRTAGAPDCAAGPRLCYDLPVNAGPLINTANFEGGPSLSQDGLTLLFGAARQNSLGQLDEDIYIATRETTLPTVWSAAESGRPGQLSRLRRLFP